MSRHDQELARSRALTHLIGELICSLPFGALVVFWDGPAAIRLIAFLIAIMWAVVAGQSGVYLLSDTSLAILGLQRRDQS